MPKRSTQKSSKRRITAATRSLRLRARPPAQSVTSGLMPASSKMYVDHPVVLAGRDDDRLVVLALAQREDDRHELDRLRAGCRRRSAPRAGPRAGDGSRRARPAAGARHAVAGSAAPDTSQVGGELDRCVHEGAFLWGSRRVTPPSAPSRWRSTVAPAVRWSVVSRRRSRRLGEPERREQVGVEGRDLRDRAVLDAQDVELERPVDGVARRRR